LAAVASYGPTPQAPTKLVVSVFDRPEQRQPTAVRAWHRDAGDITEDDDVKVELQAFLEDHGVQQTIVGERIIGCPHEEGIDYPMGRVCPQCPAWAGIDRFTHEPIAPVRPTLTAAEVLEALSRVDAEPPAEALTSADGLREALFQPLVAALERGLAAPRTASPAESSLFTYALYLFAKWRDVRAQPLVIRWLALPGEGPFDIAGDVVTQDGARILAAVSTDDLSPLLQLVTSRTANEYSHAAGVHALALLAAWTEVPRDRILEALTWLAREGLERSASAAWDQLASVVVDIEARSLVDDVRRAYAEGLVDPLSMSESELDELTSAPEGRLLEKTRDRYPPIDDVAAAVSWWSNFADEHDWRSNEPYRAPPKVGRNQPCPCGSGKKFKRCCGA
jgi:hypothetical protein